MPTEAEIDIKEAGHKSLFFFNKYILDYGLLSDTIHKELCDFFQNTDGDIIDLEPRDHFKTTCLSVGGSIWHIINNPDIKIMISHKMLGMSASILREIRTQFERNKKLRYFYGDHVGDMWRDNMIISKKCKRMAREPTIQIGAVDHEASSIHVNLHINDDLVGMVDRYSIKGRESTKRYGQSLVYTRDKGFYLGEKNIGTRWHTDDYHNHILTKREGITKRIRQAIITDPDGMRRPYFPERFTLEELLKIQREDPSQFSAQMMNEPTALEDQIFDELKYYEQSSFNGQGIVCLYCDPAFKIKDESDFTVIICGIKVGAEIYIPKCFVGKVKPDQVIYRIAEIAKELNARRIRIESNSAQSFFVDQAKKELYKLGVMANVEDITHTQNKQERIRSATGIIKDRVRFRSDWDEIYPLLIKQLKDFPNGHDDAPDALESLISMYEKDKTPNIYVF